MGEKQYKQYKDLFKYVLENKKIIVKIVVTRKVSRLDIPEIIDGFPVVSIDTGAFKECNGLTKIVIPDTVKKIESEAFRGCENLRSIKLPAKLTDIGISAFSGCKSLEAVEIPGQTVSIGNAAFALCKNLESITIPESVKSIMGKAFAGCDNLKAVTVLSPKITLGSKVFSGCNIDSLTLVYNFTALDLQMQTELSSAKSINLRTYEDGGSYKDIKVYFPAESGCGCREEGKPIDKDYAEIFREGFTWEKYDASFETLSYDVEKMSDTAAFRLICRNGLSSEAEEKYKSFLKKNRKKAILQFISFDDKECLSLMNELNRISGLSLNKYIKLASKNGKVQCHAFLQGLGKN